MSTKSKNMVGEYIKLYLVITAVLFAAMSATVHALTLNVVDPNGASITEFRWLVEEDNTHLVIPGVANPNSLSFSIHKSTATTIAAGDETDLAELLALDPDKRYVISVLPDAGYTNGGALVAAGQTSVTVNVNPFPIPTAQITVLAYHDNAPLNNEPGVAKFFGTGNIEQGLEGFSVILSDFAGQVTLNAFGNPIGTTYLTNPDGSFDLNPDGSPKVDVEGDSSVLTDANGEALIKFLAPNKYAVEIVPPAGQGWIQTSTIEGSPVVDAWVKSNEPKLLVEFGPPFPHIFIGFVKEKLLDPNHPSDPNVGTIKGRALRTHSLGADGFVPSPGNPIPSAYIGLNRLGAGIKVYLYAAPAEPNGSFEIANVPPGTYQIVIWDKFLDSIFHFSTVIVPDEPNVIVNVGDIIAPQWFGYLEGYVFLDSLSGTNPLTDEPFGPRNAFRDAGEAGIALQDVLLRFRDGTVYQIASTDPTGYYIFEEVFPWFKFLVVEVDFARFFATGMTTVVDAGGTIPPDDGWNMPSDNKRNPQGQVDPNGDPIINPNTGNNLSRTELATFSGEILLEAMQLFNDQSNRIDWGKDVYQPGENGGITGIVFYATTRAEDDPRFAAGEEWEPGIARVQIALYMDADGDGVIDDLDGDGGPTLADVDNYPFGWQDGSESVGPEDVDHNGNGTFDPGDAIQIATTDAWDDNLPQDCPPSGFGLDNDCGEGIQTWNQVIQGGVFDGGFAITSYFPGGIVSGANEVAGLPASIYIVEAVAPPGLEHVKEEDKNVDFGDPFTPSLLLLPPISVGDLRVVPDELSLFPGIESAFAGQLRPLPDRKQVILSDRQNAAVEFFMFSYAPKAARVVGLALDDLTNSFNPLSPTFGEKAAPPWLPVAFRDYNGKEIARVYSDEFGVYNALVPSTYTVNLPSPSGVVPQMLTVCINDAGPIPDPDNPGRMIIDPSFKSQWATQCYNFDFWPGKINYLDTPVIPVGSFVGEIDFPIDCEFPDGTPLIYSVSGPEGGPYVSAANQTITIVSVGSMNVANPDFDSNIPGSQETIKRDYSFDNIPGSVTIKGVELTDVTWNKDTITAKVPAELFEASLVILDIDFSAGTDGFTYADDTFRDTNNPSYESGIYAAAGGFSGGGLKVDLGAIDTNAILGMSGGWQETFNLNSSSNIVLSFRYKLTQSPNYEPDEFSEVLVSVDGTLVGTGGNDYVARIAGDGEGGPDKTTGWQQVEILLGTLSDGNNTLTIGAYNNKKTWVNESTELLIDDVSLFSGRGTGMLMVTRGDNNKVTPIGITMTTGVSSEVIHVREGESIQAAIDAASSGALILVDPGNYDEMVIMWKNLKLQGSGAFSTTINALPFVPSTKLENWKDKLAELVEAGDVDLLVGQDPTLVFDEGAVLSIITKKGEFGPLKNRARIDGFKIYGATGGGGGIFINAYASFLDISNNRIISNLGNFGGGIRLGQRFSTIDTANDNITIQYNHITQNTGLHGGGGIAIFPGADNYQIKNNFICGNFTTAHGGGIGHEGLSDNGIIADNYIAMNESFFGQGATTGGGAGGISIAGVQRLGALTLGSGSVQILSNLIQSNLARSGDGGAICLSSVNGQDVIDSPADANNWYQVDIFNNIIVNNVAALAGAICLQDAAKVNIINNTIANNDSIATTAAAFIAGDVNSTPQPAGIVSRIHSKGLANEITVSQEREFSEFSNPLIHDSIIWHNRSFYYDPVLFGTDGGGVTLSIAMPYWDLAVLDTVTAQFMDPQYCVITDINDYNSVTNISADPNFVSEYFNTIRTAAEPTEGGNFIDVTFKPLTKTGDYHIPVSSPAVGNAGGMFIAGFSQLERDFDGDPRLEGSPSDRGADEAVEAVFVSLRTVLSAEFDSNEAGFAYIDDAFRSTSNPTYADGNYVSTGGNPGGALNVTMGGIDTSTVLGLSGGWQETFDLAESSNITLSFWYKLTQSPHFEPDEYSEVLVSVDGGLIGFGGNDYVVRITGDGEGGPNTTTDWQQFSVGVEALSVGTHTLTIGAYNNKKTWINETTELLIDNVSIFTPVDVTLAITSLTATPSLISDGQTCQLFVTPIGGVGPLTYSWTVGPGEGTLDDPTISFPVYTPPSVADSNIFTITAEVSDGNDTVNDTIDITVLDNIPPSIISVSASLPAIYDTGGTGTTQLSVNANDSDGGPSALTYLWNIQAESRGTLTNETTATPTYTTPGDVVGTETFVVEVAVSDGLDTTNSTTNIIVYEGDPDPIVSSGIQVQRPNDVDATDSDNDGDPFNDHVFLHMAAGDGFVNMADGRLMYMFGFSDVTDVNTDEVMDAGMLAGELPGPTIIVKEGQKLFLTLTNVGMVVRPDLFDDHTIHFHGFPQAAPIFDGVPTASIAINMGASLTYYYNLVEPGTYMWHCHVEATEHMQMGMLANIYVLPIQNNEPNNTDLNGFTHKTGNKYVYNDGDGSTYYDVEYPIQIHEFDPDFHDASLLVQPLPFANMNDRYPMLNGRGYPDTVDPNILSNTASDEGFTDNPSQPVNSLITATKGQKILLRLTSLSTTNYHTLTIPGIPMRVIGTGARLLRGPDGKDLSYLTNSINLGGGDAIEVIIDTTDIEIGTYFLYDTNLSNLSNNTEDYGGMMTEIRITAP